MAVSAILKFSKYSNFDLDDVEGRVIPFLRDFQDGESISGVILFDIGLKSRSNQRSKVKFDLKPGTNHLYRPSALQ